MYSHHGNVDKGNHVGDCDSQLSSGIDDAGISDDGSIGVSTGDVIGGFMSQETRHSSSHNRGVYRHEDWSVDGGRYGFWSQKTIHYNFINNKASVDGDRRGGYRSYTKKPPSHNRGGRGILSGLSVASHLVH